MGIKPLGWLFASVKAEFRKKTFLTFLPSTKCVISPKSILKQHSTTVAQSHTYQSHTFCIPFAAHKVAYPYPINCSYLIQNLYPSGNHVDQHLMQRGHTIWSFKPSEVNNIFFHFFVMFLCARLLVLNTKKLKKGNKNIYP